MNTIKNKVSLEKAKVNPFEEMPDLLFMLIFQIIFFISAMVTAGVMSVIFWILFGLVTFFEAGRCLYMRIAAPWRRLHYPLMIRHAGIVGYLSTQKENENFNIDLVISKFTKTIYPNWSDKKIQQFIKVINKKMNSFYDKDNLLNFIQKGEAEIDLSNRDNLLESIYEHFKTKQIFWIIAEVVERNYGVDERVKYLCSVLTGEAR